ncbi:MAG TPA: trypsin-like peptidase domain-containing protein [Trichocoleus sp.]|jgi:serine protease Do
MDHHASSWLGGQFTKTLEAIVQQLQQSTVQIQNGRAGVGSGIIWNTAGLILTNAHVVRGRAALIQRWDSKQMNATVIRKNSYLDLAALVVHPDQLTAASIGDSSQVQVGELALAVGNPLGVQNAVSFGIIHTVNSADAGKRSPWIQADVRLAPGYSGGPLATVTGEVIGINSMMVDGRAFAITTQAIDRFLASQQDQIYLGVTLQPVVLSAARQRLPGWVVTQVETGSPAVAAHVLVGDVWTGINDRAFEQHNDLNFWLNLASPGDQWQIKGYRGDQPHLTTLILGRQAASWEAA